WSGASFWNTPVDLKRTFAGCTKIKPFAPKYVSRRLYSPQASVGIPTGSTLDQPVRLHTGQTSIVQRDCFSCIGWNHICQSMGSKTRRSGELSIWCYDNASIIICSDRRCDLILLL